MSFMYIGCSIKNHMMLQCTAPVAMARRKRGFESVSTSGNCLPFAVPCVVALESSLGIAGPKSYFKMDFESKCAACGLKEESKVWDAWTGKTEDGAGFWAGALREMFQGVKSLLTI